jgi:hypothetical protein
VAGTADCSAPALPGRTASPPSCCSAGTASASSAANGFDASWAIAAVDGPWSPAGGVAFAGWVCASPASATHAKARAITKVLTTFCRLIFNLRLRIWASGLIATARLLFSRDVP